MKHITRLLFASFLLTAFGSCKKEISKVYYQNGTAPVLTASTSTIKLNYLDAAKPAVTFSWTNPNYEFSTGVSSQDVNYKLEIDTTGANFTNPNKKVYTVSRDLSQSFTEADLNDALLNQLNLAVDIPHNIEVRVTSGIGTNGEVPLISNVLKYTVTPYSIPPKITPPSQGTLYIVGSAVGAWDNPITDATKLAAQKFKQESPTLYSITIPLIGGGEYKLIGQNGSWSEQWSVATKDDPAEIYGGDFVFNGENVLAPPTSATYKIVVDFQRGKFTVTKQ